MKDTVDTYIKKFLSEHVSRRHFLYVMLMLALLVSLAVYWRLKYTGIAMTNRVYCGLEEHTHTDECYENVLICGLEEGEEVFSSDETLSSEAVSAEAHVHTDACYEKVLICGLEEHTHTIDCLTDHSLDEEETLEGETETETSETEISSESSSETAPEETAEGAQTDPETEISSDELQAISESGSAGDSSGDSEGEAEDEQPYELPGLTGYPLTDFIAAAESQIGYSESKIDYIVSEDEDNPVRKGSTIYGQWYGNPYGDWDVMFLSYCLNYAGVSNEAFPENSGAYAWYAELDGLGYFRENNGYEPKPGDIAFLDTKGKDKPDRAGIITEVNTDDGRLTVIEGDLSDGSGTDSVCQNEYSLDNKIIFGFAFLPDEEAKTAVIYKAENEGISVSVTASQDALPEDAELHILLYDESRSEYAAAGEAIGFDSSEANMAVVDIAFSVNGEKIEPTEAVNVAIDISGLLPEDADPSTVSITHLAETEEGIEPVLVADATEETEGTIDTEAAVAEFTVDSFSSFTITWSSGNRRFTAATTSYLYSNGTTTTQIDGISSLSASLNTALNLTSSNSSLDVSGYTLETASITYTRNNQTTTISDVTAITVTSITTSGRNTVAAVTVTTSGGTTTLSSVSSLSISLYYSKNDGEVQEEEEEEDYVGLSASKYNKDAYVYWDTTVTSTSNSIGYAGAGDGGGGIASVVLGGLTITQADSNASSATAASAWSASTYQLSDIYPNANATSQTTDKATLTITPETGYYVSHVMIGCANITVNPPGFHGPYNCTTLTDNNAYNKSFQISSSGVLTVDLTSMYFSHDNNDDEYYFILIQLSPVADPLYVQYDYGEIVDILGVTSGYGGAFDSAAGWTATTDGNSYGYENSHMIADGDVGVKTEDTQYKYGYTDVSQVSEWEHYANSVTAAAKAEAAAAGYYFAGWKAEYYYSINLDFYSSYTGTYPYIYEENYVYTFNSSNLYYTTTYSEGDSVNLSTHAKLIAQWEPVELTLTKTVEGLEGTDFESEAHTFTLTLQKYDEENNVWVDYDTAVEITITGDGSSSVTFSPIGTGDYRVVEDTTNVNILQSSGSTLYLSVSDDGTLTVTTDDILKGEDLSLTYTVTNTYTEGMTEPLPETGGTTPLPYTAAFIIITGFVIYICKRSIKNRQ